MAITVVLIDDTPLSLEEMAHCCAVSPEWIMERVQAGLLCSLASDPAKIRFTSVDLTRARELIAIERHFDANPELAALVVDMVEEIRRLKT